MKKVSVKWFDRKNGDIIVRTFYGILENETAETVTFKYNRRIITINKSECFIN